MSLPRKLDPVEVRVVGCLLEKEQSTPDLYPLTLNALVAACNQRSNRDPVMELAPAEVRHALDRLHAEVLVWPVSGSRSERWRHSLDRRLDLDAPEKAVLTVLALRGPQTAGEIRGRSERLHPFADLEGVEVALRLLAGREEPLVMQLERLPGQKEARWAALLAETVPGAAGTDEPAPARPPLAEPLSERVARLEAEVATLRERLFRLEQQALG